MSDDQYRSPVVVVSEEACDPERIKVLKSFNDNIHGVLQRRWRRPP